MKGAQRTRSRIALEKVGATAPAKQDDLVLQKVELVERINLDTFKVRAVYGEDPEKEKEGEDEDDTNFTFDSSGGTMHMDVSLETKGKFPADAPDFKKATSPSTARTAGTTSGSNTRTRCPRKRRTSSRSPSPSTSRRSTSGRTSRF